MLNRSILFILNMASVMCLMFSGAGLSAEKMPSKQTLLPTKIATEDRVSKLKRYVQIYDNVVTQASGSKADSLQILSEGREKFAKLYEGDLNDFLAATFAGTLAAQRCQYVNDIKLLDQFVSESLPYLDSAVRGARRMSSSTELLTVLRNRGEVYSALPAFYRKSAVAVKDLQDSLRIAQALKTPKSEIFSIQATLAKALVADEKISQAQNIVTLLQSQMSFLDAKTVEKVKNIQKSLKR